MVSTVKAAKRLETFLKVNKETIIKEISSSLGIPPEQADEEEILSFARIVCRNANVQKLPVTYTNLKYFLQRSLKEMNEQEALNEQNDTAELFLKRNEDLIYALASRVLGPAYNRDISLSVAFLAYRKAAKLKRDQFQKTKLTTVFFWWYLKELHAIRGIDGREVIDTRRHPEKSDGPRGIDPQKLSFNTENYDEEGGGKPRTRSHILYDLMASPPKEFHICLPSFRSRLPSKDLMDILRLLHEGAQKELDSRAPERTSMISMLGTKLGCKRLSSISRRLISVLHQQVRSAGAHIYKAECLNGTNSTVIVCAADTAEAYKYLSKYGQVLSCRRIEVPR
ncbi:MAG: hypothetical protein K8I29_19215 [Alphaproteobacteria bacterium]|uniref:Uncharacterized protein n=1 Tax=Candidatus Nitrobium versatile TaxID=2884831 RepID=A0A953M3J9_9BACT|nr:hypothetical protein [Candidatus Nitrobium versatile]